MAPDAYPFPSASEWMNDHGVAVEVALVKWRLTDDLVERFRTSSEETLAALWRLREDRAPEVAARSCEIAGRALGPLAAEWIRACWEDPLRGDVYSLALATARCLPFDEGLARVAAALDALPAEARADAIGMLSYFSDPRAVEVIERLVTSPVASSFGKTAACCGVSWSTIKRWLDHGRPMGLVALDALRSFVRHDTLLLEELAPRFTIPPDLAEFERVLRAYEMRDPVPRVRRDVGHLIDNAVALCVVRPHPVDGR